MELRRTVPVKVIVAPSHALGDLTGAIHRARRITSCNGETVVFTLDGEAFFFDVRPRIATRDSNIRLDVLAVVVALHPRVIST